MPAKHNPNPTDNMSNYCIYYIYLIPSIAKDGTSVKSELDGAELWVTDTLCGNFYPVQNSHICQTSFYNAITFQSIYAILKTFWIKNVSLFQIFR